MDVIAMSLASRQFDASGRRISFAAGDGPFAYDVDGCEYIDFICGSGPVVLGHGDAEWNQLLCEQLQAGSHLPGYSAAHEAFAQSLVAGLPGQHGVAFFMTSSEAVTAAVRLSAARTNRPSFMRCGYIGWHDAQISTSPRWHEPLGSPIRAHRHQGSGLRGVSGAESPADWVNLEPESLAAQLKTRRYACLVIDAYQANFCPARAIDDALSLCSETGTAIVLDETKTAGRVSPLGQLREWHSMADYIICGKAIANGVAVSLLIGDAELVDQAGPYHVTGTFSSSMVPLYAMKATQQIMSSRDGYLELARIGESVVGAVNLAANATRVGHMVHARPVFGGSMWELVWTEQLLGLPRLRESLRRHLASAGVLAFQGHPSYVSLAHSRVAGDDLAERLTRGFSAWRETIRRAIRRKSESAAASERW